MRMQVNGEDCRFDYETLDTGKQMPIMKINIGIKLSVIDLLHALEDFRKQYQALQQQQSSTQLQQQQPPVYTHPPPPPPVPSGGFDATIPEAVVPGCAAAHMSGVSVSSPASNMDVKRGLSFTALSASSWAKNAVEQQVKDAVEIQAAMAVDAVKKGWEASISSLQANYEEYASNSRWEAIDHKFATTTGSDVFRVGWKPVKLQRPRLKQVSVGEGPQIKAPIITKVPAAIPQQVESTSEMPDSAPPGSPAPVSTCTEAATAPAAAVSPAHAVPPDSPPAIDAGAQEDAIPHQVESTPEMPDPAPPGSSALVSTRTEVATASAAAVSPAQAPPPDSSAPDAMDRPPSRENHKECPSQ